MAVRLIKKHWREPSQLASQWVKVPTYTADRETLRPVLLALHRSALNVFSREKGAVYLTQPGNPSSIAFT